MKSTKRDQVRFVVMKRQERQHHDSLHEEVLLDVWTAELQTTRNARDTGCALSIQRMLVMNSY